MHRSDLDYTPKLAATLNLLARFLDQHEQAIVFSAFHDGLDNLAARLRQAGVPHLVLDGRTAPASRGRLAKQFKQRKVAVLLAGVESMAEMHSFPQCPNAILTAYSWAWDKWEQAINRIHRINSPAPVHVWSILCEGSIDRRLDELRREKGDSQELVLDGKLFDGRETEVSLAELLATAEQEFDSETATIDEARLELEWPSVQVRLIQAAAHWQAAPLHHDRTMIAPAAEGAAPVAVPAIPTFQSYWRQRLAA